MKTLEAGIVKNTVYKSCLILLESISSGYNKRIQLLNNFVILG